MPEPCKGDCGQGGSALLALAEAAELLCKSSSSIAAPSWPVLEGVVGTADVLVCRGWARGRSAHAH